MNIILFSYVHFILLSVHFIFKVISAIHLKVLLLIYFLAVVIPKLEIEQHIYIMQTIYTMHIIPLFDSFKQLYYTVITVCVCVFSCMHLYCIAHGPEAFNANKHIIIILFSRQVWISCVFSFNSKATTSAQVGTMQPDHFMLLKSSIRIVMLFDIMWPLLCKWRVFINVLHKLSGDYWLNS